MEEILHHLIASLSQYLQGFIHPWWCRSSSINSIGEIKPITMVKCMLVLSDSDLTEKKCIVWGWCHTKKGPRSLFCFFFFGYFFSSCISYTHTHPTGICRVSVGSWVDKSWGCHRFSPLRGSLQKTFGKSSFVSPKGVVMGPCNKKRIHRWHPGGNPSAALARSKT